jgi:o-succinylbenzoate synthase
MKANFIKYILHFKKPSGTSRGVLKTKETWFIKLENDEQWGIGECGLLRGLSIDDRADYEEKLRWVCDHVQWGEDRLMMALTEFPSIQMGLQTAFKSFYAKDPFHLFNTPFSNGNCGIPINGLIWMGDVTYMKEQIADRLKHGFTCIKLKIGAIDFKSELQLLKSIRKEFSPSEVELRVDANGAFLPKDALDKLSRLAELNLHSIEQPIAVKQWEQMAQLCLDSPLPIALDEELIGIFTSEAKKKLIELIRPQYIILKPSFIGGFLGTDEWIQWADSLGIEWWVTSALESNIGLNAISQYTSVKNSKLRQGLGTGSLYTNNIPSPLEVSNGELCYNSLTEWDLKGLKFD